MKAIVCGGRLYDDRQAVFKALDAYKPDILVHGGCATGADAIAETWCRLRGKQMIVYYPDWHRYSHAAGPIRNQEMLKEHPDLVIAFPGGRGTLDMTRRAINAGVSVVYPSGQPCLT